MMRRPFACGLALLLVFAAACAPQGETPPPAPFALTPDAMGRYCGMNVLEHEGPKGQVILAMISEPIWFSSARDAIAFTMLPDEPKDIAAIYVSDMGSTDDWANPGAENWIDARTAFYVIGSERRGGMGVAEAVPFSQETTASAFAARHGGRVVGFSDMPQDYILGDSEGPDYSAGRALQ